MQSSAMRGVNTPDEVPLLSWARWCSRGRPLIHDGRIACSCRQQATKCVSEAACCFYRLPEAAFCRGKQQPAPETIFEMCVPPAAARKLHPAAATLLAKCDRCDLPPQAKKSYQQACDGMLNPNLEKGPLKRPASFAIRLTASHAP